MCCPSQGQDCQRDPPQRLLMLQQRCSQREFMEAMQEYQYKSSNNIFVCTKVVFSLSYFYIAAFGVEHNNG